MNRVENVYRFDGFEIRRIERELRAGGQVAAIGSRAFDVLLTLLDHRDRVVSKNELLDLQMPKFELRTSAKLKAPLMELGLGVAFGEGADFTGISKEEHLAISEVVHQAFVKVNEAGTEAAAATAVIIGTDSVPLTRTVIIDRPFLFLVRDNATGAIVFIGRIAAP